jgi:butyrate kinase
MAERILAINPGSTSTKIALFEDEREAFTETIRHSDEELNKFRDRPILDQLEFRLKSVLGAFEPHGVDLKGLSAIVGRGGLLKPLQSGTYRVNERMLQDLREARRGEHASNLGAFLAQEIAKRAGCPAFIVDPVSVDEWPPIARLSGLKGLDRECLSHALNTKAVAKRFAKEQGRCYEDLRLIVAHLGSGFSISAHEGGRMIDVTNSREEGAFSTERAGSLPVMKLVDLCFSDKYTRRDLERLIFREGGVYSYLGTRELREVLQRVEQGDDHAKLVFEAMLYQIAKEIGAMATVLKGRVDAILITGGLAHLPEVVEGVKQRVSWIAPVHVYPGEDELKALAEGALRVLRGEEPAREYI